MQETVAAGSPSSSAIKKPSGSTEAKQLASLRPGFQPSAAAQSTANGISSGRMVRMLKSLIVGNPADTSDDLFAVARRDCFAEPVIRRRFAPTGWLAMTEITITTIAGLCT